MAYANHVSKTQIIELLGKLANDDGYRSRFESSPEGALAELDFPAGGFAGFLNNHAGSGPLADKIVFSDARRRVVEEVAGECLCMVIPSFRLDFGNQPRNISAAFG
ncbi:MAG: NHLP-related RiPP peptide [Rudaea sp.]